MAKKNPELSEDQLLERFITGKYRKNEPKKGLSKTQKIQILTITTILGFVGLITVVMLAIFNVI